MKSKISVLHLIDSGGLYGAENVIINLSTGLQNRGHRGVIGCICYTGKLKPEVGMRAEELGLDTVFFEMKNKIDFTCVEKIAHYYKENKIQIIHSHGYKPSFICFLIKLFYRIPYIITCHLRYLNHFRLKVYGFLEKLFMFKAEAVVGVSQAIINDLKRAGVPSKKLILINNGINTEMLSRSSKGSLKELRQKLSLEKDSFVIGTLGRLTEQKDHKTFIKAASELLKEELDVEFIVAGEGHLKNELISLTKKLGIDNRFHFIGFQKEIPSILKLMDIFVLSSLDEGLPIALLEAMAARRPIVSTAVGEVPHVIEDGVNGKLFKKSDFVQFKNNLICLKRNSDLRKKLSINAFCLVREKYSNEKMAEEYIKTYNTVLIN